MYYFVLVVLLLLLLIFYMMGENFGVVRAKWGQPAPQPRIYRGPFGPGGSIISGAIPSFAHTYGYPPESCQFCPTCVVCPHCPQCIVDKPGQYPEPNNSSDTIIVAPNYYSAGSIV
jgi:hypothetical protein